MLSINKIQSGPGFRSLGNYKAIKMIPNITCACCGQKVIAPGVADRAWGAVSKPLNTALKKGAFTQWMENFPQAAAMLQSFSIRFSGQSLDKIINNNDNYLELRNAVFSDVQSLDGVDEISPDPHMATKKIIYDMQAASRNNLRSSSVVMKRFSIFKDRLHGYKKDIFEQFQIYAKKYPRKSLSEIVNMDEIYKFHRMKDLLQRAESREQLDYHFGNIKEIIVKKRPDLAEKADELKEQALEIYAHGNDTKLHLAKMKNLYEDALKENNLENLKWKVFDELKQVPETFTTVDSFMVYAKHHNYSDGAILSSLIVPSMSSYEHIIPKSDDGEDKYSNGLVLCRECNQKRASVPYSEYVDYHPEMRVNTQRQMDFISQFILGGKLPQEFVFYPVKTSRTLYDYSGGKINVDVENYCKKALAKSEKKLAEKTEELCNTKDSRDKNIKKRLDLQDEIKNIDQNIETLNDKVKTLVSETRHEQALQSNLESYLRKKK